MSSPGSMVLLLPWTSQAKAFNSRVLANMSCLRWEADAISLRPGSALARRLSLGDQQPPEGLLHRML